LIAEINGKISRSGSNLNERLEDNLTGNVFGALRYIPFENGIKQILLRGITPKNNKLLDIINNINLGFWSRNIKFWPYDKEGEIDLLLEFETCIIGIEVKYLSGISSDDGISNEMNLDKCDNKESIQQLARESRIISRKGNNKDKILIFIADQQACIDVYNDVIKREIIEEDVNLVYISWQNILESLKSLYTHNEYEKIIINDLVELLTKKGFEQFKDFLIEDINIRSDYYNFGDIKTVIDKVDICFSTQDEIKGELHYEF
jgi:hypothetical protein